MDKPNTTTNNNNNKHKNNSFLKFLPKAASVVVSFQNPPFSPGRSHAYKGYSGPINFANLPDEARRKPKNNNGAYESQEPTSPKISCMGQIKCKHKSSKKSSNNKHNNNHDVIAKKNSTSSSISKFFGTKRSSSLSKGLHGNKRDAITPNVENSSKGIMKPSLGQMRKFASGRESNNTLGNFDWTAQIAPIMDHDIRECFSDEERRGKRDGYEDEDEDGDDEKEVIIAYSAPMLLGGGRSNNNNNNNNNNNVSLKPRKEVNLWKRRTMDPPPPLALKIKHKFSN
ncbi:hypothetical protein vseg_001636 [Gypsophila vaccaria]